MGRVEKTVFISYRRTNLPWALAVYQNLTTHGYDVFFDYQSIDAGDFEKIIIESIKARAHFLVILTPSAIERCKIPSDWLRREIETAIDENRNIVPLMLEGFDFGNPLVAEILTGKLNTLNKYNGLHVYSEYFFEAMDKLRLRYLNVEVSNIALLTPTAKTIENTKTQKIAAGEVTPVEREQLIAQEWYERGFVFQERGELYEAIRCYVEAIRLKPDQTEAFYNLEIVCMNLQDKNSQMSYERSLRVLDIFNKISRLSNLASQQEIDVITNLIKDVKVWSQQLELETEKQKLITNEGALIEEERLTPEEWYQRGRSFQETDKLYEALRCYAEAIRLKPELAEAYFDLEVVRKNLQNDDMQRLQEKWLRATEAISQTLSTPNYQRDEREIELITQLLDELRTQSPQKSGSDKKATRRRLKRTINKYDLWATALMNLLDRKKLK